MFYLCNACFIGQKLLMTQTLDSARRADVIARAADLIVEGGLAALTVRNIARRLGCSTTVISHHFRNKDEVVLETYRYINAEAASLRDQALSTLSPTPLRAAEEILPIGPAQQRHWIAWLHFWSAALLHPALAAEHAAGLQAMVDRILDHLRLIGMPEERARAAAQNISNALYGIAMQAIFDLDRWDETKQRNEFRRAIAFVLGKDGSGTES